MARKQVYILTCCRRRELLYGTTLIFQTVRAGFPTASICVVDNNSVPEVRGEIAALAAREDCEHYQLERRTEVKHADFIAHVVRRADPGTVVFVDPDVVFWRSCEDWSFDALAAGRLIPDFSDEFTGCLTRRRLHTSLLWIPQVERLREALVRLEQQRIDFDPWTPYMYPDGERWVRFDTGASLHAALPGAMHAFGERELDAYDHLFCGSHLDLVAGTLPAEDRRRFEETHAWAQRDLPRLRGIWRAQERYFSDRRPAVAAR